MKRNLSVVVSDERGLSMEAPVSTVKGYSTGQNPEVRRFEVPSLDGALSLAAKLKSRGYFVEIRDDPEGNVVSEDPSE